MNALNPWGCGPGPRPINHQLALHQPLRPRPAPSCCFAKLLNSFAILEHSCSIRHSPNAPRWLSGGVANPPLPGRFLPARRGLFPAHPARPFDLHLVDRQAAGTSGSPRPARSGVSRALRPSCSLVRSRRPASKRRFQPKNFECFVHSRRRSGVVPIRPKSRVAARQLPPPKGW